MPQKRTLLILIGLILFGFALRTYQIEAVSFRGDEAFTVLNWVSRPLIETLQSEIPLRDPQPPLAFATFRVWGLLLGTSEFSMRILPAMLNLLGIPALYALGRRIHNRRVGLLAAFLWTIHPFILWHAQDARIYAIWAASNIVALWLGVRALEKQHRLDWGLYTIIAIVSAYLYYLELFALLALNVYALVTYWRRWHVLKQWFASQLIIGLVLAPWFLQERLLFGSGYGGTTFPFEPARIYSWLIPSLNFGARTLPPDTMQHIWLPLVFLLVMGLIVQLCSNRRYGMLLGLIGFLPVALLSLVSLRLNVFEPRYILSTIPAYLLLIAGLIVTLTRQQRPVFKWLLPALLMGGWLLITGISLNNYYFDSDNPKAPDWRGLVRYLEANASIEDIVLQAAADEAFTFYFNDLTDFQRIPANPRQSRSEIINTLEAAQENYHSIWLVAHTPDDWPNANIAPEWLSRNMQQVRDTQVKTLRIEQYMPWEIKQAANDVLATFEDVAKIVAVDVSKTPEPAAEMVVWVYWQPVHQTTRPLKAFVHLVGPVNPQSGTPLWSQDDHYPLFRGVDTTQWSSNQLYRDVFTVPIADLPANTYEIHIGLYDPETGERVPTGTGDTYRADTITLP